MVSDQLGMRETGEETISLRCIDAMWAGNYRLALLALLQAEVFRLLCKDSVVVLVEYWSTSDVQKYARDALGVSEDLTATYRRCSSRTRDCCEQEEDSRDVHQ